MPWLCSFILRYGNVGNTRCRPWLGLSPEPLENANQDYGIHSDVFPSLLKPFFTIKENGLARGRVFVSSESG